MQEAWTALLSSLVLAGCGFQATPEPAPSGGAAGGGAPPGALCWTISDDNNNAHWSACATELAPTLTVTGMISIDTDGADSSPPGLRCAPVVVVVGDAMCALAAASITIAKGATLSAHGTKPLALLGHTIDIQGTIDVASHIKGQRGPGATDDCNPMAPALQGGGGAGGTYVALGGRGGNRGGAPSTGGLAGDTENSAVLRGGCDGRRGGDGSSGGSDAIGGPGGGGVWISSDTNMLKLGDRAVINASGASGTGGTVDGQGGQGGQGGGSGGTIVLQSITIDRNLGAQIFANGGHGGGGAAGGAHGDDGTDPTNPGSGGGGGGGPHFAASHGDGGSGYPGSLDGDDGDAPQQGGGGGGGGDRGAIHIASTTPITGNVSPPPQMWTP